MFELDQPVVDTRTDINAAVKQVFDATPVAMILSRPDGSFEYVNPALKQMLGYDNDIYDADVLISHPGDLAVNRQIRERLHRSPFLPVTIEKRYLHKDGRVIPGLLTMVAEPDARGGIKRFIAQVVDLTERRQAEESLWFLTTLLNHSNDAVVVIDPDSGHILDCNEPAHRRLSYSKAEMLQLSVFDINQALPTGDAWAEFTASVKQQGNILREGINTRKDGTSFPVEGSISYITQGNNAYLFAVVRDITHRVESEALIRKQANFDSLTDLPNRRFLKDRLEQEIQNAHTQGSHLAVLYMDLDRFKEVNDTLGHSKGDMLLLEATRRLKKCIRPTDTLARLGGDEFTILLSDLKDYRIAEQTALSVLNAFKEPFHLNEDCLYVTMSIGIAFYPEDGTTGETLFKAADQAMYEAKAQGRNNYQQFTQSMHLKALLHARLIRDLRRAISEQQFCLYYQPIVELSTGKLVKAEALIRWQHPTRGMINPDQFISAAEETGLISEIGDWVFRQAAWQTAEWRKTFSPNLHVSINSSPVQYLDKTSRMSLWLDYLRTLELPQEAVSIEVTEGVLMDKISTAPEKLRALHDAGISISLDDFGTGYSSLAYLKKYAIDFIKIDRSFVQNLTTDSDDLALCEAIIVMAHKLRMRVIAEGIETEEQQLILRDAGCDYGQGYLYSEPVAAEEFEKLFIPGH